ncbi:YfhD family protein [Halalkalibacter nanhaiisediminis]|uniref:YfhD-like protein n=1 Tax=Halalkalibacter nanhaiisediminis TaxID=688079 RepID=A0A562QGK4_9BACI|nr:YfhD family protein [Halalkalibacter nanhaiisediminis]TWI55871.1 YfhD-like protein [Halalkalibacter nanhaiisediminis]
MSDKKVKQQGEFDEVKFSSELADTDDKEAMARMEEADKRAEIKQKN